MLKSFTHIDAKSVNEAAAVLEEGKSRLIAGGTDLLTTLKDMVLAEYPETIVNLKTVEGLEYIKEEGAILKIGALTKLADIADNPIVQNKYTALAQAAKAIATPNIRQMGTLGGNLAQLPRCWYFRKPDNCFPCLRKGGSECFASVGESRYHSIMGGMRTHTSECKANCPAGTNIPSYLAQLRAGNWDAAAEIIMQVNPMSAITARVCTHFCQLNCNRCKKDEGVQSGYVERTVGDYILDNADRFYKAPDTATGKKIAIIGSGPAGLSAAFYLRKAGNEVTVYDTKPEAGGMLRYAIPAYRLPKELVTRFVNALQNMGILFKLNVKIGETIQPDDIDKQYDAVLYATGAWKRPVLGFSGEELTVFGLDFLVEIKKWMGGKVGQEVVVMGGGNVAMDVAISAKRLGADKVRLTCLEPEGKMPASEEEIARAREEGIEIDPGWGLSKVVEKDGKIIGLEIKRCISPWDEYGNFNPQYDENDRKVLTGENILMATGQGVDLSFLDEKYQIQLNRGRVGVNEDSNETSRPGVFAAGDVMETGTASVIGSVASGHKTAIGVSRYLGVPAIDYPDMNLREYVTFDPEGIKNTVGLKLVELDASARAIDKEDSQTPDMDTALKEAGRCLNCACYIVNPSDTAPALIALNASIVTNKRSIPVEELFAVRIPDNTVLDSDEIIKEIQVPRPPVGAKSVFSKFALRKSIDFSVVNTAILAGIENPRVVISAVAPKPYRAYKAEAVLAGKKIDAAIAAEAGEAAVADAQPLEDTKYKVQIAKTVVKRALLSIMD